MAITKTERTTEIFTTSDGREFTDEKNALFHEHADLLDKLGDDDYFVLNTLRENKAAVIELLGIDRKTVGEKLNRAYELGRSNSNETFSHEFPEMFWYLLGIG